MYLDPQTFHPDNPSTWPIKIPIIAHDVGRTHDRSTAVVGGHCPLIGQPLLGVKELLELPIGLYGSALASELAAIDLRYERNCVIVADLTNDASYGETLYDTFGRRLVGVRISHTGDGTTWERRLVRNSAVPVYRVGRTFLLENLLAELRNHQVRMADTADSRRAFAQLTALEVERREHGIIYKCPSGQHDDLEMSLAMLVWAAKHPHLEVWTRPIYDAHRPRRPRIASPSPLAWT